MTHSAFTDSSTRNTPEPGGSPRLSKGRQAKRGQNERPLVAGRSGIVTSGLLVYSAIRQASSPPTTRYAVAAHDIAPGHVLSPDDVSYTAIDLPHAVQVGALRPDTKLDGVTALGPVAKGELLQSGALVRRPRSARLFSFPIDTAFAVGGRIGPGLRVAVYSTDDDDAVLVAPSPRRMQWS
jgi:Flp pilus assembly protein CpaB